MSSPIKLKFWCNEHRFVEAGFGEPITEVHFNQRGELGLACPLCHKSRPMTIVRWTGLKDKNGTEIFEGDIVKMIGFAYGYSDFVSSEVTFGAGMFCVAKDGGLMLLGGNDWEDENRYKIEVIGNIYETPELLEPTS